MPSERARFPEAEARVLDRYGVAAERQAVSVPCLNGQAHVLSAGQGPPVLLAIGAGAPVGAWAPLMAELSGFSLHAVELPGMGLTRRAPYTTEGLGRLAVDFLDQVIEALGLRSCGLPARTSAATRSWQLSRVALLVRLIRADGDPFGTAGAGRRAAQILPQADFHLVPGGHAPWVNQPRRVAELVGAFLHRHRGSPAPRP
jgi:pimeloyl-ACP methyl ester carboxylesterase